MAIGLNTAQQTMAGQVAFITGASQGLGVAIAHRLASLGIHLALCARSEAKLNQLKADLRSAYPNLPVHVVVCDVQRAEQVEFAVQQTQQVLGRLDILINNAGVAPTIGLLQELSVADIDRTIDTNLKGAIYAMRAVLPAMVQRQSGFIININSIAGKTAYPFWGVYDASKFGMHAITQAVAAEQRSNGIKVAGIYPGAVDTPIWDSSAIEKDLRRDGMLEPDDVADAVAFLLTRSGKNFISELTLEPLNPVV